MLVTTLPITLPRPGATALGALVAPFASDVLSRFLPDAQNILAINNMGMRSASDSGDRLEHYTKDLKACGISWRGVWMDTSEKASDHFRLQFENMVANGQIFEEVETVYSCRCGALEIPKADLVRNEAKVYSVNQEGVPFCRVCSSVSEEKPDVTSLYAKLETCDVTVLPLWIRKESEEFKSKYQGCRLRISRIRKTPVTMGFHGRLYNIDVEFHWSFFVTHLSQRYCSDEIFLVTHHRTLRQALFSSWISIAANQRIRPTILVTPTLRYVENGQDNVRALFAPHRQRSSKSIRYFLANGLGWNSKECIVPSTLWYWIDHSVHPKFVGFPPDVFEPRGIEGFLDCCCLNNAQALLASLRKKRQLTTKEAVLYKIL